MTAFDLHWSEKGGASGSEALILREYRGEFSSWTLAAPDLPERERRAWQLAEIAGISVPDILAFRSSSEGTFALMRRMPGVPVWELATPALIREQAATLARLHALDLHGLSYCPIPRVRLSQMFASLREWALAAQNEKAMQAVERMSTLVQETQEYSPVFLHGDFHAENVLTDGEHITCVLDWEDCAVGDPRWDVAYAYRWFVDDGNRRAQHEFAEEFVDSYTSASERSLADLALWIGIVELREWVVGSWLRHRLACGEIVPITNVKNYECEGDAASERFERLLSELNGGSATRP